MTDWSLPILLEQMHGDVQHRLEMSRKTMGHPVSKGDASESVWLGLFSHYLPHRYNVKSAHIVDSKGVFSEQIDIVVFDRQYTPFIFSHEGKHIIPAESVYAVFEVKQSISTRNVRYACKKVASVRQLKRTSLRIPHAGGTFPAKRLHHIFGGILALKSDWNSPIEKSLKKSLASHSAKGRLDCGCIASEGMFYQEIEESDCTFKQSDKVATQFLFYLIKRLQQIATVPMIDIDAYARWLEDKT